MPSQKLTFPGHSGEMLAARLDTPPGPVAAYAIFAHCFTCTKDIPAAAHIARALAAAGVAVLRFDFTGLGHSEGEFANTHFTSNTEDLLAAARYLEAEYDAPSMLIGHSLGGAAVLAVAGALPSVKAVATLGAPFDPEHVLHNFGASLAEIEAKGEAEVSLAGRPFRIKKRFVEDVAEAKLKDAISAMKTPLLVLHAPVDATVGIENAAAIFEAAKHPKSFVSLDQADHLITDKRDALYAAETIAAWAKRYLPVAPRPAAPEGDAVRATELAPEGFLHAIQTDVIETLADEPISAGGTNLGLTPFEFLSGGLAACTSMTLRAYARRKNWPLAHVSVDVVHEKVQTDAGRQDHFHRAITVEGDLDKDQRARLLEIANKCPVHRTLHGKIEVTSEIL